MTLNREKSNRKVAKFYRENSAFFDYEHEQYRPPVRITEIGASHWGEGDSYNLKNRRHFSVNLVTRGNVFFQQRKFHGLVHPGQVFLCHINAEQWIRTGTEGFATRRFMFIGGELLPAHLLTTGLINHDVVTPRSPQKVLSQFRLVYKLMREKPEGFIEELMVITQKIFMELGRSLGNNYPEELNRGIAFIQRNLHRPIKHEEIFQHMHVSNRQCVRLFNTHLKMPPIAFVHQQKQKWAESLLQRSQLSIREIASILGFEDQFYFSNRFKKFAKISPSEFRAISQER